MICFAKLLSLGSQTSTEDDFATGGYRERVFGGPAVGGSRRMERVSQWAASRGVGISSLGSALGFTGRSSCTGSSRNPEVMISETPKFLASACALDMSWPCGSVPLAVDTGRAGCSCGGWSNGGPGGG